VVDLIRGPKQSIVRLQVLPSTGDSVPQVITLERNQVRLEAQAAQAQRVEVGAGESKRHIGVIKIPTFYMDFQAADAGDKDYRSTTRDVRRLIKELEEEGIDGLVIDLRANGGGSLREATDMTGLFLPGAPVVQVRRNTGEVEVLNDSNTVQGVAYAGPLAVMVDGFSASASEIFAAAIQDHGRGVVVGQQTFGKGTVQNLVDLDHFGLRPQGPMGRLKLTIAQFYRISGASTQQRGVIPDIELPSPMGGHDFGENSVDNALPWGKIKPVSFRRDTSIETVLPHLRERHEERVSEHAGYQALLKEYEHLRALQNRTTAPLTEQARRAERDRVQSEQLAHVNRRRAAYGLSPLESLDQDKTEEMPDALLEATAAIVADLKTLSANLGKLQAASIKE
jgi:carboxyl-terminal processing protease